MSKQTWKAGNMIYPLPALMVSVADENGKPNIITVAWCGTTCTNPAMAYISVRKERYSYDILTKTKEFVLNLTTEDLAWACDYCGVKSGKDTDKFKDCGLTALKADQVNAPLIAESPVNIECRVKEIHDLGSHTMFLADVLCVHADEAYMDETGRFSLEKAKPICYSHGTYFTIGEALGGFGFSVKKSPSPKVTELIMDAKVLVEKADIHAYIKKTLKFPEYYGANLDALYDCLSELPENSYSITIKNPQYISADMSAILNVFKELDQ